MRLASVPIVQTLPSRAIKPSDRAQTHERLSQLSLDQFEYQGQIRFSGANEDLYRALKYRKKEVAKRLVKHSNADINMFTPSGETFLTLAVQRRDQEGIQFVHQLGADINQADKDGWTPLGLAVANGQKEIARLLHRLGADLTLEACPGQTALGMAVALGNTRMVNFLLDELQDDLTTANEQGKTPLTVGAATGSAETLALLLDKADTRGLNLVNAQDKQGWTPLTLAATKNQLPNIRLLHERGGDLNLPHAQNKTPLECAQRKGHTKAVELIETLLKTGPSKKLNPSILQDVSDTNENTNNGETDVPDNASIVSSIPSSFDFGPDNASEILSREELLTSKQKRQVAKHTVDRKQRHNIFVKKLPTVPERIDEQAGMMDNASTVSSIPSNFDIGPDNTSDITSPRKQREQEKPTALSENAKHHVKADSLHKNRIGKSDEPYGKDNLPSLPKQPHPFIRKTRGTSSVISGSSTISSITGYLSGSSPISDDLPHHFIDPKKRIEEYFTQESERGAHPLIDAAVEGNLGQVRQLVNTRRDLVNDTTDAGATALQWAASLGRTSIVEFLLNEVPEIDVNLPNASGHTPLIMAAAYNHPATVSALMKAQKININLRDVKGDINSPDAMYNKGHNPLLVACKSGHAEVVRELLKSPELDVNIHEIEGNETPLTYAVKGNHYEIAKDLLSKYKGQIQINQRNNRGNTPLMIAAENGYKRLTKLLLAQDDIEVNPPVGYENQDTALIKAAQGGDKSLQVLERLLSIPNIQLNAPGKDGKTALVHAAEKNHEKTVQKLLAEQCIKPTLTTFHGDNALTLAALNAKAGIIQQLLATNQFNVNHKNRDGNTALHQAASTNNLEVIELLLAQQGIKPGLTNKRQGSQLGQCAAQVAESKGWVEAASKIRAAKKPFWALKD